jgi:TorA-specific chaperone
MPELPFLSHDQRAAVMNGLACMSRVFWGPEPELCAELAGPAREDLAALEPLLSAPAAEAARRMSLWLAERGEAAALCDELETAYVRLFVNTLGGVAAPLYHSVYQGEGLTMGPPAQEMARRLAQAGLSLPPEVPEPADHLAVELEYLILLLEQGWQQEDPAALAEAAEFAGGFMLPWLVKLAERLAGETECPFYPQAVRLTQGLLSFLHR